jgi:5'-deoxynucleotidase YfbR-like HD superfamily hydrolase
MEIKLERHLTCRSVGEFSDGHIPHPVDLLGEEYVRIIDKLLTTPRTGWDRRGVPVEVAETGAGHCGKTAIAVKLYIAAVGDARLRDSEDEIVLTAGTHDLPEWKAFDWPPEDINKIITPQEKKLAEMEAMKEFTELYDDPVPERLFLRLETDPDWIGSPLVHQSDKFDAATMAMNYEAHGYSRMEEFYPYTRKKLSDPFLIEAFEWLLQREFPTLDYFYQYCTFLRLKGNVPEVRQYLRQ